MSTPCRVCGRPLRTPRWVARRIGPVCARRLGDRASPRIPTPAPDEVHPGQLEVPLPPIQSVLTWST